MTPLSPEPYALTEEPAEEVEEPARGWTTEKSAKLYQIAGWGLP